MLHSNVITVLLGCGIGLTHFLCIIEDVRKKCIYLKRVLVSSIGQASEVLSQLPIAFLPQPDVQQITIKRDYVH